MVLLKKIEIFGVKLKSARFLTRLGGKDGLPHPQGGATGGKSYIT